MILKNLLLHNMCANGEVLKKSELLGKCQRCQSNKAVSDRVS